MFIWYPLAVLQVIFHKLHIFSGAFTAFLGVLVRKLYLPTFHDMELVMVQLSTALVLTVLLARPVLTNHCKYCNPILRNRKYQFSSYFFQDSYFGLFLCWHIPLSGDICCLLIFTRYLCTNSWHIDPWVVGDLISINFRVG